MMPASVIVVDDVPNFRNLVVSLLQKEPELQVMDEASDGIEAVRKAKQLHPDLILLDIGMPNLNGLDAARFILRLSPESKIIFVSQESSIEIVQEAFDIGARGYVVKMEIATELLSAVACVLRGNTFIGARFASFHLEQHA